MRRILIAAFTAAFLWAGDVAKKDFSQWTQDDALRILHDSPWAKDVVASFDAQARKHKGLDTGVSPGSNDPANGGMPGGPGRPPVGGMSSPMDKSNGADMPRMNVTVRWESALPVKQAQLVNLFGKQLPPPGDPAYTLDRIEDHYVVAIAGIVLPKPRKKKPGEEDTKTDRVRDEFFGTGKLIRRGKPPLLPEDVKVNPKEAPESVLFFFPKTDPLTPDEKEVVFEAEQGDFYIRRAFHLKEMIYRGKLEL